MRFTELMPIPVPAPTFLPVIGFINTKLTLNVEAAQDTGDVKVKTKAKDTMMKRVFLKCLFYHFVDSGYTNVKSRKLIVFVDDAAITPTSPPTVTLAKTPTRSSTPC